MAGSEAQATIVYNYFQDYCEIDGTVLNHIIGGQRGLKIGETENILGKKFICVAASPKSVRGKHEDTLLQDETVEIMDELILAALPIVNQSKQPLIVMASTFHKIFGVFAETWDNAEERGYVRISWDIFDVCSKFPKDYWENGITQDGQKVSSINGIEKLKAFAKGRTGDPDGWIPIENVVQAWREKSTEDWFEVEYLGNRPSSAGLVLKPEDVDKSLFDSIKEKKYNFIAGADCVLGIDWGFSTMTAVVELMGYSNAEVVLIDNRNYHQTRSENIIEDIVAKVKAHNIRMIYADSAGKFENAALQSELNKAGCSCVVIEVVFGKEKFGTPGPEGSLGMIGNLRAHFEQEKFHLAKRFRDAFYQLKNYRYQEGTDKPVKKDDHIPDAIMCALQHFPLGQTPAKIYIPKEDEEPRHIPYTRNLMSKQF